MVGVGALARSEAMSGWHHGMMDGTHSAAEVSAHVDHMLKHFYVEVDATDAQKAQIGPLVKQAVNDLHAPAFAVAVRAQPCDRRPSSNPPSIAPRSRRRAPNICSSADEASKRIVQLIGDVGDVLTPTQRKALAEHLAAAAWDAAFLSAHW